MMKRSYAGHRRRASRAAAWGVALAAGGCGSDVFNFRADLHRERGTDGQRFTLEDIEAVTNDPNLTDDEKRQGLIDLGVRDEDLLDALLDESL